jgi:hypothetical protein
MNAGFSNLYSLKTQLLAPALVAATDFDARITALGLGVAAAMENYCNRKFTRQADDQYIASADRAEFTLPRYPLESVSLIELKTSEADGWQTFDKAPWAIVQTFDLPSGLVRLPNDAGKYFAQVRFTYTGGFWWEQKEPADNGYPTTQPAGSNALPNDLQLAFYLQCKSTWESFDKIGDKISEVGSGSQFVTGTLANLQLVPVVKQMLGQFIRWQIT